MKTLNLKHPEIYEMAAELARRRNTSLTGAVVEAVRNELTREQARESRKGMSERLLKIGKSCAAHLKPGLSSTDHGKMLYDELGLPR